MDVYRWPRSTEVLELPLTSRESEDRELELNIGPSLEIRTWDFCTKVLSAS